MIEPPQILLTTAQLTAFIHVTIPREEMPSVIWAGIREVLDAIAAQGVAPAGPWFTHHLRRPSHTFDFEICVPVASPIAPVGRVVAGKWPAIKVAQTVYHGAYEGLGEAWGEFLEWIEAGDLHQAEDLWECYLVGPQACPDPGAWRTQLSRPLRD